MLSYLECLFLASDLTMISSSVLARNCGSISFSSVGLITFVFSNVVTLSLTVGNMSEIKGDLPIAAVCAVRLTKSGLISPLGLYAGFAWNF